MILLCSDWALLKDSGNRFQLGYNPVTYFFSFGRKADMISSGTGKTIVELFSEATSVSVCRNRSCKAEGFWLIMLAASDSL